MLVKRNSCPMKGLYSMTESELKLASLAEEGHFESERRASSFNQTGSYDDTYFGQAQQHLDNAVSTISLKTEEFSETLSHRTESCRQQ